MYTWILHPNVIVEKTRIQTISVSGGCRTCLQGFVPLQPQEHKWGPILLADERWALRPSCLDLVEVKFFHTKVGKSFLYALGYARGHCHDETGQRLPQAVAQRWKHTVGWNVMELHAIVLLFPLTGVKYTEGMSTQCCPYSVDICTLSYKDNMQG